MFGVTPRALQELSRILSDEKKQSWGVRLFVEGMPHDEKECWILFEDKPRSCDRLFLKGNVTFVVGPESGYFLKGKTLEWDEEASEFWVEPAGPEDWDEEEWAYLDSLPAEEPDWDIWEGEWVEDDEAPKPRGEASRTKASFRLPRGWRPAP